MECAEQGECRPLLPDDEDHEITAREVDGDELPEDAGSDGHDGAASPDKSVFDESEAESAASEPQEEKETSDDQDRDRPEVDCCEVPKLAPEYEDGDTKTRWVCVDCFTEFTLDGEPTEADDTAHSETGSEKDEILDQWQS